MPTPRNTVTGISIRLVRSSRRPHGKWDDKTRTMTWTSTDEDGNKSVGKTKIIDNNTHEWTVVTTSSNGKLMLDLYAKNTRRKE